MTLERVSLIAMAIFAIGLALFGQGKAAGPNEPDMIAGGTINNGNATTVWTNQKGRPTLCAFAWGENKVSCYDNTGLISTSR